MLVSKKEFNYIVEKQKNLEQDRDSWKAKYEAVTEDKVTFGNGAVYISTKILAEMGERTAEIRKELEDCQNELNKYRQLYADEVQKRLDLIKTIEEVRI